MPSDVEYLWKPSLMKVLTSGGSSESYMFLLYLTTVYVLSKKPFTCLYEWVLSMSMSGFMVCAALSLSQSILACPRSRFLSIKPMLC
jgi:hypothetical protein